MILDQTQLVGVDHIKTELETCKHKLEQCKDELKDLREEWAREKDNLKGELEELYKLMIEERKNMNAALEVEQANTAALGQYLITAARPLTKRKITTWPLNNWPRRGQKSKYGSKSRRRAERLATQGQGLQQCFSTTAGPATRNYELLKSLENYSKPLEVQQKRMTSAIDGGSISASSSTSSTRTHTSDKAANSTLNGAVLTAGGSAVFNDLTINIQRPRPWLKLKLTK